MNRSLFPVSKNVVFSFILGCLLATVFAFKILNDSPAVAIELTKNNVFYIGFDNPVVIIARGFPNNEINIQANGLELTQSKTGDHNYTVRAKQVGEASITVSANNGLSQTFRYRVKRIPDPVVMLGARHRSKSLGNGEFKAQGGLAAVIENFDFDAKCDVQGYSATRLSKKLDPENRQNTGARFNPSVTAMIQKAKPGDTYFFDEIKARCPGDVVARELGSLVFRIR